MILTERRDLEVGMLIDFGNDNLALLTTLISKDTYKSIFKYSDKAGREFSLYSYHNELPILTSKDENLKKEFEASIILYKKSNEFYDLGRGVDSIGSDPECFVLDKDNKVIPSYLFLKSKEQNDKTMETKACVVGNTHRGSGTQSIFWDGFQAEFNVFAHSCLAWTVDSTFIGLKTLQLKARKFNPDAKLTIKTTLDIDQDILDNADPEHVAFGCMPSSNAYGMSGMKLDGRDVSFRSAGGHIHLGLPNGDVNRNIEYVKALDKILGVACVSLFAKYDDPRRRLMYGLAGEYRTPPHGIEYRTLSNAWLSHPLIMNIVFELSRKCISADQMGVIQYWDSTEEETIACINNCDVELSREILARNKFNFIQIFDRIVSNSGVAVYKLFMLGMDSLIKNPEDIEGNWGLSGKFIGHCEGNGMKLGKMRALDTYQPLLTEEVTVIYEELVAAIKDIEAPKEEQKQLTA
jgi:hypothetical protein